MALVEPAPSRDAALPLRRAFAQDVEPGAQIGAALGVVRVRAGERRGPRAGAIGVRAMETAKGVVERAIGSAADLVARRQRDVDIERSVLDAFGGGGSARLLQPLHEGEPRVGGGVGGRGAANEIDRRILLARAPRSLPTARSTTAASSGSGAGERPSTYVR